MNMNTNRVEAFSDEIVAIIITIMVLEFELPDISKEASSTGIKHHLVKLLPLFWHLCVQLFDDRHFMDPPLSSFSPAGKTGQRAAVANLYFCSLPALFRLPPLCWLPTMP